MKIKQRIVLIVALLCLLAASGCTSTKTERGVIIENQRNSVIPFL